jgi:hypothetical protein
MYIFGRSHIENVTSWQKTTDTIVFVEEPVVRLCKKVRSKWSGNCYPRSLVQSNPKFIILNLFHKSDYKR